MLRRSVAQELCEAGAVTVNGAPARPTRTVRPGDEITLKRRERLLSVRVLDIPATKQVSRGEAPGLYEVLRQQPLAPNDFLE